MFRALSGDTSGILRIPITLIKTLQKFEEAMRVLIILDSLLYNCHVVDSFLSFLSHWLRILSVPLQLLFNRWLFLLTVDLKLKNCSKKCNLFLRTSETNHSSSDNWHDSCLSFEYLITLYPVLSVHLFISGFHAQLHCSSWFHCAL